MGLIHLNTRLLQMFAAAEGPLQTGLVASIHLGLGSGMTLRNPHMSQDPPPVPAKLTWGLKRPSLEPRVVFLGSSY